MGNNQFEYLKLKSTQYLQKTKLLLNNPGANFGGKIYFLENFAFFY